MQENEIQGKGEVLCLNCFIVASYIVNEERKRNAEKRALDGKIIVILCYLTVIVLCAWLAVVFEEEFLVQVIYVMAVAYPLVENLAENFFEFKVHKICKIKEQIKPKPIFQLRYGVGMLVIWAISCGVIAFVFQHMEFVRRLEYGTLNIMSMLSVQATISFLSITLMNVVLPDKDKVVMGISYKSIFFKTLVYRYFNIPNCIMYLVLMLGINIVTVVFACFEGPYKNVAKICFVFVLLCSLCVAFYTIHLALVAKYKNSRIYHTIYRKLRWGDSELYCLIISHMLLDFKGDYNKCKKDIQCTCCYYVYECDILNLMLNEVSEENVRNVNASIRERMKAYGIEAAEEFQISEKELKRWFKRQINTREKIIKNYWSRG